MLKRTILALLLACGLTSAHAQGLIVSGAPAFTGTAIGSGFTFTGTGTQLFAVNVAAYKSLTLPLSTSMWVHFPTLGSGTNPYFLNALDATQTAAGFATWAALSASSPSDSLLLDSYLQPNVTSCAGAKKMCANLALINDANVHHLCTAWSASGSAFYVDGILQAAGPAGASMVTNTTAAWTLGLNVPSGTREVDVAVWNRALTPAECTTIYNRGHAGFSLLSGNAPASLSTGLIAYWSLSNCSGGSCPDGSPTNNPATSDTAPTLAITSPTNGQTGITGTLTVSATCTDSVSVTSVAFSIDGSLPIAIDTTFPYATTFDTTLLLDAGNPHTATAVCTNNAGVMTTANNTFSTSNGVIAPKTYYLATVADGGSDANPGTQLLPWHTANHDLRCDDVILAKPSHSYVGTDFGSATPAPPIGSASNHWGTVWSCPATLDQYGAIASGSIDPGASRTQFAYLKCDIATGVEDCFITTNAFAGMNPNKDHWAIQGWTVNNTLANGHCFAWGPVPGRPAYPGSDVNHGGFTNILASQLPKFNVFINDYVKECGGAGFGGTDYNAVVGSLIYHAAWNGGTCYSGYTANAVFNTNEADTGTHLFLGGNFIINNSNQKGCTDGEGIILDDWSFGGSASHPEAFSNYNGQAVVEQSLFFGGSSFAFERNPSFTPTGGNGSAIVYFDHNTTWGNGNGYGPAMTDFPLSHGQGGGEIGLLQSSAVYPTHTYMQNSLIVGTASSYCINRVSPFTCPPASSATYTTIHTSGCTDCTLATSYLYNTAAPTQLVGAFPITSDTSTHADPVLAAPAFITTAPDCSASLTVYACMVTAGIVANFQPTLAAAISSGYGYRAPLTCTDPLRPNDALYPIWLKGAVPNGLLTKPCGY